MNDRDAKAVLLRASRPPGAPRARRRLPILLLLALWGASPSAAQNGGTISGRVVSARNGAPVASARIDVPGTGHGAASDADGRYSLHGIPAGRHSVVVQAFGFARAVVDGVEVAPGGTRILDLPLQPAAVALEGITVSARPEPGSGSALRSERRSAATVVDAIGAEQIARSPDRDAAAALRRVPGVTVVDGRFVYVRGLGERYGATTLNGAPISSPVPDRKAVPLDLIPAGMLRSVVTAKTYSPDQPGDYAGGLVQLETRSYPRSPLLRVTSSVGVESSTSLAPGLAGRGGRFDWLGLGGGAPGLPAALTARGDARAAVEAGARSDLAASMSRAWVPGERGTVPVNQGWGLTFGNEIPVGERTLGFVASASFGERFSSTDDLVERFFAQGAGPSLQVDYRGARTTREVSLGGLVDAGVRLDGDERVSFTAVLNRLVEDEARELGGLYESQGPYIRAPRLQYTASGLLNAQLKGEHQIEAAHDLAVRWRVGYSRAGRLEPDTRTVVYRAGEERGPYEFFPGPSSGLLFHQSLADRGMDGAVDLKLPVVLLARPVTLALGGSALARTREVYTRRFRLAPNGGTDPEMLRLPPGQLFAAERIGAAPDQFGIVEATFRQDNYEAGQATLAGYAMVDAELLPRLRLVAGARLEHARQELATVDLPSGTAASVAQARRGGVDVLPALNLTFAAQPSMNLRFAASRTVARPQFRELAPFLFADYYGGLTTRGNPYLERGRITNADLRWEWFPGRRAVLSAGTFLKRFDAPIEPFAIVLGSSPGATWVNSERASLLGAELELRSSLGALGAALEAVEVSANLTLVRSAVRADSVRIHAPDLGTARRVAVTGQAGRPLFGQSPYVVNLGATYEMPGGGTSATLLFNRFGRRLDAFGGQGLPDIYEEGRSQLDLVLGRSLGRGMEVKLSAGRLVGNRVRFTQTFAGGERVVTRQFSNGRTLSLSLAWEPGDR